MNAQVTPRDPSDPSDPRDPVWQATTRLGGRSWVGAPELRCVGGDAGREGFAAALAIEETARSKAIAETPLTVYVVGGVGDVRMELLGKYLRRDSEPAVRLLNATAAAAVAAAAAPTARAVEVARAADAKVQAAEAMVAAAAAKLNAATEEVWELEKEAAKELEKEAANKVQPADTNKVQPAAQIEQSTGGSRQVDASDNATNGTNVNNGRNGGTGDVKDTSVEKGAAPGSTGAPLPNAASSEHTGLVNGYQTFINAEDPTIGLWWDGCERWWIGSTTNLGEAKGFMHSAIDPSDYMLSPMQAILVYTPLHTVAHRCTPLHTVARRCTPLHAVARRCTPLHAVAHRCTPCHAMPRHATCKQPSSTHRYTT